MNWKFQQENKNTKKCQVKIPKLKKSLSTINSLDRLNIRMDKVLKIKRNYSGLGHPESQHVKGLMVTWVSPLLLRSNGHTDDPGLRQQ